MDGQERDLLLKTLGSFSFYPRSLKAVNRLRQTDFAALSQSHQTLLPNYLAKLDAVDRAITQNTILIDTMLHYSFQELLGEPWSASVASKVQTVSHGDMEKGAPEREATYGPILQTLETRYANCSLHDRRQIRVLTPGCGLGRLSYEIAKLGFDSVGNEFSYHMLIASAFLLNGTTAVDEYTLQPFIHSFSNHRCDDDLLREVGIPDEVPSLQLKGAEFSMCAGEFIESFSGEDSVGTFDVVVTCFFMDTAHNAIEYIETIRKCMKRDGIWINLGPCLWHYELGEGRSGKGAFDEEGNYVGSIELSVEDLMSLVQAMNFDVQERRTIETTYMGNRRSMLHSVYEAEMFIAQKKAPNSDQPH